MAIVITNQGECKALEFFVNKTAPENLVLKLFKSNTTPAETHTTANYTEADFTGYSALTLTGSSWGSAAAGDPSFIAYSQQTFELLAVETQSIYGYYLVGASSGVLYGAERFTDGPYVVTTTHDKVRVTPRITAS